MPQNEVKLVFTTDDSAVAQTVKKIHDALGAFEKVKVGDGLDKGLEKAADSATKLGKASQDAGEKTRSLGKSGQETGEHFSKVADHTTKAHQALELFGKVGERILEPLNEVKTHVVNMGLAFVGIGGAWEMVKRVFEEGQAFNAARGRFLNLIGDSKETREEFEQLDKVADETGLHIGDIARGAEGLYAAGEKVQGLSEQMENLAKISVVTGTDLGELTELLDRMKTHGDVSFRELFRLTQATGGATRELAVQYRDLPKILEAASKAFDSAAKIQEHATKIAEQHRDALEGVAKKGGLAEEVFKDFGQALERTAGRGLPAMDPAAMFDVKKFGTWGTNAAQELWGSFNAGIQQISSESGISVQSVIAMVRQGLYSMDELLSAAKARRQAIAEQSKAALEASKAMMQSQVQQQQVAILDNIVAKLNDANSIQEKFNRSISGWGSEIRLMGHQVEKVFEGIGVSWIKNLKPALDVLSKGDAFAAFEKLPVLIQGAIVAFTALEAVKVWNIINQGARTALAAIEALTGGVKALQVAEEAEAAVAAGRAGTGVVGAAGAAGGAVGAGGLVSSGALAAAAAPVAVGAGAGIAAGIALSTTSRDPRANLAAEVAQRKAEADQRYIEAQQKLDPSMEGYKKALDDAAAAHQKELDQIETWRKGRERTMVSPIPAGRIPSIDEAEVSRLVGGFKERQEAREKAEASAQQREYEEKAILQKAAPYTMPTKEVEQYVERYAKYVADYRQAMREASEGDTKRLQAVNAEREQLEALAATITPKAGAEAEAFEEATKTFSAIIAQTGQDTSEAGDKNKEGAKDIKDAAEKNNASAKNILDAAEQFRAAAEKAGQAGTGQFQPQAQGGGGGAPPGGGESGYWGIQGAKTWGEAWQMRANALASYWQTGSTAKLPDWLEPSGRIRGAKKAAEAAPGGGGGESTGEAAYDEEQKQRLAAGRPLLTEPYRPPSGFSGRETWPEQQREAFDALAAQGGYYKGGTADFGPEGGKISDVFGIKGTPKDILRRQKAEEMARELGGPGAPAGAGTQQQGEGIGPKVDVSNQHLAAIKDAIQKALTASGAS